MPKTDAISETGLKLATAAARRGWSRELVARKTGLHINTVDRVFRLGGHTRSAERIAKALGVVFIHDPEDKKPI